MTKSNRGKNPSDSTTRILCGKAAGMCQFRGCNKRLFYDNLTLKEFNNAYVAHIVASSPDGPRGDAIRSHQLSDKIENLMLMCADHHNLIDKEPVGPIDYPESVLLEMKREHEEKIQTICSLFYVPHTEIVLFSSPIKGKVTVNIDFQKAAKAILPDKQPASHYGLPIQISSVYEYRSKNYWDDAQRQIQRFYTNTICSLIKSVPNSDFSIFPLAPIPLIVKLGEILGDKMSIDVYQKFRVPDTWDWQSDRLCNDFTAEAIESKPGDNVALILSLTNDIETSRIPDDIGITSIYKIKAVKEGVDCISSKADLSAFWHCYQTTCDSILNKHGKDCIIHLFPAIPVSAAFEVGRRYMPRAYPKMKIYDEDNGFFEALVIGG